MLQTKYLLITLFTLMGCPLVEINPDFVESTSSDSESGTDTETGGTNPICGNSIIEENETCDFENLNGETCESLGFIGGDLYCYMEECSFNTSQCLEKSDFCGNEVIEFSEECDSSNLNGETCDSQGFKFGDLSCNSNCIFNFDNCWTCGDGIISGVEQCEGTDFDGLSCDSFGFPWGELLCSDQCLIDLSHCSSVKCAEGFHLCSLTHDDCCPGYNCHSGFCLPE